MILTDEPTHSAVIVACASIISESDVSITILCLLCPPRYTAVQIKNCSISTFVITVATMKNTIVLCAPVIVWNWSIHYPSLSAMFDLLHSSTNQEGFENHLCSKSSHHEYGRFLVMQRKPSHVTTKLMLFTVSKNQRWMEHKGGHWQVPQECIAHTVVCQKAPLGMKRRQTVKKSSP